MSHLNFQPLLSVTTREELRLGIIRASKAMGFGLVSAFVLVDFPGGGREIQSVHNMPSDYTEQWGSPEEGASCPVMQHCKTSTVPIVWDQSTYVDANRGDKWETQAAFGLRTGLSIASHHPDNRHFCLGLDRPEALPRSDSEITRMLADLTLFSVYAQEAASRILVPQTPFVAPPALTPREREALQWTSDGKTAWEIGQILDVSEGTVAKFLASAQAKLSSTNKTAATVKAMRLGLIA